MGLSFGVHSRWADFISREAVLHAGRAGRFIQYGTCLLRLYSIDVGNENKQLFGTYLILPVLFCKSYYSFRSQNKRSPIPQRPMK